MFEGDFSGIKEALLAALKSGANLRGANLRYADLRGANLVGAKITVAQTEALLTTIGVVVVEEIEEVAS